MPRKERPETPNNSVRTWNYRPSLTREARLKLNGRKPRKFTMTKSKLVIRDVIREVSGYAPYEKRIMELIKVGNASASKRATKLAKKRLGTLRQAKIKRTELTRVVQLMKHQQKAAH